MGRTIGPNLVPFLWVSFFVLMIRTANGQNVNNDGNLTFESLPAGEEYLITTGVIPIGGFTLRTTWNIIDGFLKMISPAGPPYDLIAEAIAGNLDTSQLQSSISELRGNFLGFIILFILGLVFTIIFLIFLLVFCCCRLCGNCGGKMVQKNSSKFDLMRYIYSAILLVTLFFITFGAITALAVSGYTSSQVANLPDTIGDNIDDMLTYVNNTLGELDFLVIDQLSWTLDQVTDDLSGVGDLVGVPVREGLRPTVGAAIDAVYPLDQYIKDTLDTMESVNTTQGELEDLYDDLDAQLTSIFSDLSSACGSCSCCGGFDYSGLSMNADYRDIQVVGGVLVGTFPQQAVTGAIGELENVVNQNLTAAADVGSENFENIPTTLYNTTAEVVNDLVVTLGGLQDSIYQTVNESTSQLSTIDTAAEDLRTTLDPYLEQAVRYDSYRDLAMSLAFSFVLLVAVLFLVGMALGIIGHCLNKRPPASRSGIESCGGCTVMIASVLAGILVVPFMLISSFTFVIGGPLDRLVCDNLLTKELFTETIDQPGVLGEGYFLGEALFQDNTIPVTVSGMLDACEQNTGIYTAFQLENLLNISQFTDIDSFLGDIDSQFGNITGDFSGVNILTGETRSILVEFRDSSADTIPWDAFLAELAKSVTNDVNDPNDLSVLADTMDTAAASIGNSGDRTTIEDLADDLRDIQTNYMAPLIAKKTLLAAQIDTLTNYTDGIDTVVNDTIEAADTAQDFLDDSAVNLVQTNIVGYQARILGYPYQFAEYIEDQIQNEVGRCLPVYNLYSSSVNTFCLGFIQAFNGFWYCLGLCTFMFIIAFAFGIKSSKYYRRMKQDIGFEQEQYGIPLSENKVAPEQVP